MSRTFAVDNERKDWMLEDFPVEVRRKCKAKAAEDGLTLKAFVEKVLREAVGLSLIDQANESKQRTVR